MRSMFFTSLLFAIAGTPTLAVAQVATAAAAAPAATAKGYTVADTDLGTLLDDPAAKAVIVKDLPGFAENPQIDMARGMTLSQLQQYAADTLTDAKLAVVQADLNKLPVKK